MTGDLEYASGVAIAAMHLHVFVFGTLLKSGALTPIQVREMLDAAMLGYEHGQGVGASDVESVAGHAREQVRLLLETLEATSPEMKAQPTSF